MTIQWRLLLATLFWGATPTIGRVLAEYRAPFVVVFGRFFVASLFLVAFSCVARQFIRIPFRRWPRFALLGASGILLHNGLLFKGLEFTEASTASIILGLIATQVVILDWLFYGRKADRLAVIGVLLGFLGTAFVITGGDLTSLSGIGLGTGEVLVFLSALSWAAYSVFGRTLLEDYSPLTVTTLASCAGLALLFPFVLDQPAVTRAVFSDPRALALIFFLGFAGSALGFLWYYQAVVRVGTVGAALYINLTPLFGVLSAALFLGETVSGAALLGGLMVFAGLMLVNRPQWGRPGPRTYSGSAAHEKRVSAVSSGSPKKPA